MGVSKLIPSAPALLTKSIVAIVTACRRFRRTVPAVAGAVAIASIYYSVAHFQINTQTRDFISASLPWRQDMIELDKAFPQRVNQIIVVIDGKTPELAEAAAQRLSDKLKARTDLYDPVLEANGGPFFEQNALLFIPTAGVQRRTGELLKARPLLSPLASDPSLRGIVNVISFISGAIRARTGSLDDFDRPMAALAGALDNAVSGRPAFFSWRSLLTGEKPDPRELRQIIELTPVLNYKALRPGEVTSNFVREAAKDFGLTSEKGVTVRLTGSVPLADEQYSALEEGATLNRVVTALVVLIILWAALKSPRIVLTVALSVLVGLSATAAVGLLMVGTFNLISLAFGVLFVGIGTDFAIQFSVRYRSERHQEPDFAKALRRAAGKIGRPLALATAATAAGFYSFLPTDYYGIAELGLIAGTGMFIAFVTTITLVPALLSLLGTPIEMKPIGFKALGPVDRFMDRNRKIVVFWTLLLALVGTPLIAELRFDFNPINLASPTAESVATLRDLAKDPQTDPNTINVLAPSLADAQTLAEQLRRLPDVARVTTLQNFVPEDQDSKLAIIRRAAAALKPALNPDRRGPPPSDAEDVEAMERAAQALTAAANGASGKGADDARHLAGLLRQLAAAPPELRKTAREELLPSLDTTLNLLRTSLGVQKVTLQSLPPRLKQDWMTPDGRARIDVAPAGDPDDNANLIRFSKEVRKTAPNAAGQPIIIQAGGDTVLKAFVEAGGWALLSITMLLLIVLRRVSDVLLTLIPLVLAGLVTLEIAALIGLPLNFANIMALPLLLGLGVAFKIYFVMAWRAGATNLLESALARAVIFSAMTTATAFGSLWLSRYPGMSSLGKMLALSLACTLAAAVLFQPALMGPPRKVVPEEGR